MQQCARAWASQSFGLNSSNAGFCEDPGGPLLKALHLGTMCGAGGRARPQALTWKQGDSPRAISSSVYLTENTLLCQDHPSSTWPTWISESCCSAASAHAHAKESKAQLWLGCGSDGRRCELV